MSYRPALPVLLLVMLAGFGLAAPEYVSGRSIENLMAGLGFIGILAICQYFPFLHQRRTGLSVGAIPAQAGLCAFDQTPMYGPPGWAIPPLVRMTGTLAGVMNAFRIAVPRPPPFIERLTSRAAYRSPVHAISGRRLATGPSTRPITGFGTLFGRTQMGVSLSVQQILTGVILPVAAGDDRLQTLQAERRCVPVVAEGVPA